MTLDRIEIIKPDDWHVHLREGDMLEVVAKYTSRINHRAIVMPNLKIPITSSNQCLEYKKKIMDLNNGLNFLPLIPCYLNEKINLEDFRQSLINNIFVGAKLYPRSVTTNSNYGISNIEKIFQMLDILQETHKPLLIHGEKLADNIDLFDREKYFVDDELKRIRKEFPDLKIVLEHVSSKYGADFVQENINIGATITPHHMILTKKDVFDKNLINPHNYCMPVAKEESDLLALRKYACSGNKKFFLGTDSAPHHLKNKSDDQQSSIMPGIFSSICSIEIYASIFDEEDSINNLENFSSINGANFYNLPVNTDKITLSRESWIVPEYTSKKNIKIKNFFGEKKINWKVI